MSKMSSNEYLHAVLLGVVIGMSTLTLVHMLTVAVYTKDSETKSITPAIEVVDRYNGCDILRYAPANGAKYQYFMDCKQ